MVDIKRPRRGSMAFRPRKRAETENVRVYWYEHEKARILGFAGYKVGMTRVIVVDNEPNSPTKGKEIAIPVTVIEVPPLLVYGVRIYKKGKIIGDIFADDEEVLKKAGIRKKKEAKVKFEDGDDLRLLVLAQPEKAGLPKKNGEKFEIGLGGSYDEKVNLAKQYLGKELKISEVFKPGEFVDVIAVTKGKGWQGEVKRFGVTKQRRKATQRIRHVGTLGQKRPGVVFYTVPRAGQTGYHKRTELNKWIVMIGENPEEVNVKGGWKNYGVVRTDYVLVKGSVPGPAKRLIKLRLAVRKQQDFVQPQLVYLSKDAIN